MTRVKRAGTVKLLQWTADLSNEDRDKLLKYVGELETNEDRIFRKLETFMSDIIGNRVDLGQPYA